MRILALMTEAFGALGGIQKFNRDWLHALAGLETVDKIEVLVLRQGTGTRVPAKVSQICPVVGKLGYSLSALGRAMSLGPGDLIICGHIHLAPLAIAVAKISGARTWLHIHGVDAWSAPGPLTRRSVKSMSLVSSASRFTRGKFLQWSDVNPFLAKVLPNVVDKTFSPGPIPSQLKSRLGLSNERVLLTVGRLAADEGYKGQDRIIRALPSVISEIPNVTYLIAGVGDDMPRLKSLAETLSVERYVQFLGRVDNDELVDLYRLAHLFVLPSEGEGFGIVYLEAMASGCPALGLASGGSADALGSSSLGNICSRESIPREIVRILKNASHAAKYCESVFSNQAFARHVSAMLGTLSNQ
jgi:phosphatidylinositol alpha-1,6-mannosyltransferase